MISVQKDFAAAIIFALGATANELNVNELVDLKYQPDRPTYVALTLGMHEVMRELCDADDEHFYVDQIEKFASLINSNSAKDEYLEFLKFIDYDFRKQIHFYDAVNRKMFWSMFTTDQDELICTVTNMTSEVRQLHALTIVNQKTKLLLREHLNERAETQTAIHAFKQTLPADRNTWVSWIVKLI